MPKILLAEDSSMNRHMVVRMLRSEGFEVVTATNGKEAVAAAKTAAPQLILMDLTMPEMDGWEAATKIKGCESTKNIPIIALTGETDVDSIVRARTAGFDGYMTKPVDFKRLFPKIHSMIASSIGSSPPT